MIFGSQVGSNLLRFEARSDEAPDAAPDAGGAIEDDLNRLVFKAEGFASSANYSSGKRTVLVLFINGRLVDCTPLKRSLETVYASVLSKTSRPFFYVSVTMPPYHIDVNVHPTKKEVHFLHQDDLVEAIRAAVEAAVFSSNDHRTFYKQTLLPGAGAVDLITEPANQGRRSASNTTTTNGGSDGPGGQATATQATTKRDRAGGDYKLVRTDAHEKKLETFFFSQDKAYLGEAAERDGARARALREGALPPPKRSRPAASGSTIDQSGTGAAAEAARPHQIALSQLQAPAPASRTTSTPSAPWTSASPAASTCSST